MKRNFLKIIFIVIVMVLVLFLKVFSIYNNGASYLFFSYNGFEVEGNTIIKYNNGGGNVVIPSVIDGVTIEKIGDNAFNGLNIDSIIIPDTIISIGDYAFANNNISALKIPDSVKGIGEGAFIHNDIKDLVINEDIELGNACFNDNKLDAANAFFYRNNYSELISYGGEIKGNVEIPEKVNDVSVNTIGEKAFFETYIISVLIPESINIIKSEAFKRNYLIELFLSSNIDNIEVNAFSDNFYLSEIIIDKDFNSILNYPWGADYSSLYWLKK